MIDFFANIEQQKITINSTKMANKPIKNRYMIVKKIRKQIIIKYDLTLYENPILK